MPCEEYGPIKWLFHRPSPKPCLPPRFISAASPLIEGDWTPCAIEKVMLSQGEGEQSTKLGGRCPYWPQPPLCCKLVNEFPAAGGAGGAGGVGGAEAAGAATVICPGCSLDCSLGSETARPKVKLPAVLGVPEIAPVAASRARPGGSWPDATEKL